MAETKNILLVGVGGQGTILASKVLATGLIKAGYDVKMSEVHGMAQRGGSVTTQIRYGEKVYSPIIGEGQADIIVAFEMMEAERWISYLKPGGKIVVNDNAIPSVSILAGDVEYPKGILENLKKKVKATTVINAIEVAKELGNVRTQNIVLLGSLVKALELDDIKWEEVIKEEVKEQYIDINIKALNKGKELF